MPSLALEAANFEAPIHLRTAGDGTLETAELSLSTYPFQALTAFEFREENQELWFEINGEMEQYKNWTNLQKANGQDIVVRGETPYSSQALLAVAYSEMLGRQKQEPVEGTLPKGKEVLITIEKLNEGLQLMYPEMEFILTGNEEEGFQTEMDGMTFWVQAKAKNLEPYLAETPVAEDDIPFPQYTVNEDGQYLNLYDALSLYTIYGGQLR